MFVNLYLRYEPVTDADRDNMRIRNKKESNEPVPDPSDQVSVEVRVVGQHILDVLLDKIDISGSANTMAQLWYSTWLTLKCRNGGRLK
jgi:hypothetical protein